MLASVMTHALVWTQYRGWTDGRMDGQTDRQTDTDRQTELVKQYRALHADHADAR